jgi:hypothetical protein
MADELERFNVSLKRLVKVKKKIVSQHSCNEIRAYMNGAAFMPFLYFLTNVIDRFGVSRHVCSTYFFAVRRSALDETSGCGSDK